MSDCKHCEHPTHDRECAAPITEDIYVGNGTFDPVGRLYRSMIVDTCHCSANA